MNKRKGDCLKRQSFFLDLSRPEIALHKKKHYEYKASRKEYVKRTQRDYTVSFKLQVVTEIENGELLTHGACRKCGIQSRSTVIMWLRKHGTFDWEN